MDCQKLIRQLVKAISVRGTIPRAATVRVAERLGCSRVTVDRWISGGVEPRKEHRASISALIVEINDKRNLLSLNGK